GGDRRAGGELPVGRKFRQSRNLPIVQSREDLHRPQQGFDTLKRLNSPHRGWLSARPPLPVLPPAGSTVTAGKSFSVSYSYSYSYSYSPSPLSAGSPAKPTSPGTSARQAGKATRKSELRIRRLDER